MKLLKRILGFVLSFLAERYGSKLYDYLVERWRKRRAFRAERKS